MIFILEKELQLYSVTQQLEEMGKYKGDPPPLVHIFSHHLSSLLDVELN
jgi:hypothetical protein